MPSPHIHVLVSDNKLSPAITGAIARLGASASFGRLRDAMRTGMRRRADAVVIVENEEPSASRLSGPLLRRIVGPTGEALVVFRDRTQVHSPSADIADEEADAPDEARLAERLGRLIARTNAATAELRALAEVIHGEPT